MSELLPGRTAHDRGSRRTPLEPTGRMAKQSKLDVAHDERSSFRRLNAGTKGEQRVKQAREQGTQFVLCVPLFSCGLESSGLWSRRSADGRNFEGVSRDARALGSHGNRLERSYFHGGAAPEARDLEIGRKRQARQEIRRSTSKPSAERRLQGRITEK